MNREAILRTANRMLELNAFLFKTSFDYTYEHGYVPTDECPLRPTGQHRTLALMINDIDPEAGITCPFCNESWYVEMAADWGEDW